MLDNNNYDLIFKLVLIGDSGVGKTNILSRYISNEFSFSTKSTVGVEFGSKIIKKNEANNFNINHYIFNISNILHISCVVF